MGKRLLPGFGLTMGVTLTMLSLVVLLPMATVFGYAIQLTPAELLDILSKSTVQHAFMT